MREKKRAVLFAAALPSLIGRRQAIRRRLIQWEKNTGLEFPWRTEPRNPYTVLVSELLLRRTTSKAAMRVFSKVISTYPTLDNFLNADLDDLETQIAPIGLRNQRKLAFASIIHTLRERFRGKLPSSYCELESISHIGPYTAAAVMAFGRGIRMPLADSNIERIVQRLFVETLQREPVDNALAVSLVQELLPRKGHELFIYGLLDLGAGVCRYDKPRCGICPIRDYCETGRKS